jgi:chitodextrinase
VLLLGLCLSLFLSLTACTGSGSGSAQPVAGETVPAPIGVTAYSGSSTSVHVMWNRAGEGSAVSGYEVYQDGVQIHELPAEDYMVDVLGLRPDTRYAFTVRALDGSGRPSVDSRPAAVTTLSADTDDENPPTAPPALQAEADGAHAAVLTWEEAQDDVRVTSYDILQSGAKIHTVDGEDTSSLITGLRPDTEYVFTVVARDAGDNVSPPGPPATITTAPSAEAGAAASSEPGDFTAELGEGDVGPAIDLSWVPPETGGIVTEYQIYLDGEYVTTLVWGVEAPRDRVEHSVMIEDQPGRSYRVKTRARLPDGHWGAFSPEATVTLPG